MSGYDTSYEVKQRQQTIADMAGLSTVGSFPVGATGGALVDSVRAWADGATVTSRAILQNTTAAANNAQQLGPAFESSGYGWKTTATAASQYVGFRWYTLPVQGTDAPSGKWILQSKVGAGSWSDVMRVNSAGGVEAIAGFTDRTLNLVANTASGTGLGTCDLIYALNSDRPMLQVAIGRTVGAGNVAFGRVWRASTTSMASATAVMDSVGWTTDAAAYVKLQELLSDGSFYLGSGNAASAAGVTSGAGIKIGNFIELLTIAAGGVTSTTTAQIPAGAVVLCCSGRVTTAIPGSVTWSLGISGATTRYGTALSGDANTTCTSGAAPAVHAAAESVLVTCSGDPGAATGRVRISCMYYVPVAPTS